MPLKGPGSALSAAGPGVTNKNQGSSSLLGHRVGLTERGLQRALWRSLCEKEGVGL